MSNDFIGESSTLIVSRLMHEERSTFSTEVALSCKDDKVVHPERLTVDIRVLLRFKISRVDLAYCKSIELSEEF